MNRSKKLKSGVAAVLAVAAAFAPSVFGESRHQNKTDRARIASRIERGAQSREVRRDDRSPRSTRDRTWVDRAREGRRERDGGRTRERDRSGVERRGQDRDRSRVEGRERNRDRSRGDFDRGRRGDRGDRWRNDESRYRRDRDRRTSDRDRRPYYAHGRVSHVRRYDRGFRVWIVGAPYPFFVPHSYYHRNRFRVGVSIRLGGYYNPLGYYDYYDGYYDNDRRSTYSAGTLRGIVETVDYRRGTFVVRNDATGSFVTILVQRRGRVDVSPGDSVELTGDWTRAGDFNAYDVFFLDKGDRRR